MGDGCCSDLPRGVVCAASHVHGSNVFSENHWQCELESRSANVRWDTVALYSDNRNAVAQGTGIDLLSQGQRGPDRKSGLEVTSDKRRMETWSLSLVVVAGAD